MKVQVEVEVPAGMIVYDAGIETIRCGRCGETATITSDGRIDVAINIRKFLVQHVSSCLTKSVSSHPSSPGVTHRG